ncbi:hypothetical protein LCGC14_0535450 [marine sediment metagenome]|uniref:Malectin domain-containing protein n=1 Tax=marine sediment metagenome TaxID=412755 RepID=A0A0F9UFS0_9ZZZZ
MAIVTGQDILAADVNARSAGHITILLHNYDSIGQGTWVYAQDSPTMFNGIFYPSSAANLDNITYKAFLAVGTYTIRLVCSTNTANGIIDFDIDAVEVASFDTYAGSLIKNVIFTQTGIVVATGGLKSIKMRADGKNGSSSGFTINPIILGLWRTV